MKEHPILFSTDMVKAILDGRKTQTRRLPKLDKINKNPDMWELCTTVEEWEVRLDNVAAVFFPLGKHNDGWSDTSFCPYGQVGDRLWVRETFCLPDPTDKRTICYRASNDPVTTGEKWKPSIHMPRWASRITLEITDIRVERVQEISDEDAIAEGIVMNNAPWEGWYWLENIYSTDSPTIAYGLLWDSLNGKRGYGWDANPWVWIISFEVIK